MAVTTAIAIAVSGTVVALVGETIADHLAQAREDARLLDAVRTLVVELEEDDGDPAAIVDDETAEVAFSGIHFAVFDGATRRVGDDAVPSVAAGACETHGALRACGTNAGSSRVAVAARATVTTDEQRRSLDLALLAAVLVTAVLGASLARLIGGFSVAPLARLTDRVARLDPQNDAAPDLGGSEGVEEVDALRETLQRAVLALHHALGQSRAFARDAAHELRTPLAAIRGEHELLAERLQGEDAEALTRARRTTDRLASLVERLLVLARPAAGLEATEPVRLDELAEDLVATLPGPVRSRVTIDGDGSAPPIAGDGALLAAMLASALDNALKYSGDRPVVVRIRASRGVAVVEIDDEGPGVPQADRESMFLPFRRSASARASGVRGEGIGLALVSHVAALHGGRASFEDGAIGARLCITIPVTA